MNARFHHSSAGQAADAASLFGASAQQGLAPSPAGLSAITGAQLFSPSHIVAIDLSDARLEAAKQFGTDVTVNNSREDPLQVIHDLTGRLGADESIEAAGVPATFELAVKLARPGGRIANVGVRGEPATLHLEENWIKDITLTTGLVDTSPPRH